MRPMKACIVLHPHGWHGIDGTWRFRSLRWSNTLSVPKQLEVLPHYAKTWMSLVWCSDLPTKILLACQTRMTAQALFTLPPQLQSMYSLLFSRLPLEDMIDPPVLKRLLVMVISSSSSLVLASSIFPCPTASCRSLYTHLLSFVIIYLYKFPS